MKAMVDRDRKTTKRFAHAALIAMSVAGYGLTAMTPARAQTNEPDFKEAPPAAGAKAKKAKGKGKKEAVDPKKAAEERYQPDKTFPTKVTWALRSINGKAVPADYEVTFKIDENFRGSGFGGCNYWSSTIFPQAKQKLMSGPVAVTKKMCEPARMQIERAFLIGVHSGPDWDTVGAQLTLKGKGGALVFDRAL